MSTTPCPYCLISIDPSRLAFECAGGVGSTCVPREDSERIEKVRSYEETGPVFSVPYKAGSADCPACGKKTRIRACPECHKRLPGHFAEGKHIVVAIVGARASGKSVLQLALAAMLYARARAVGVGVRFVGAGAAEGWGRDWFEAARELFGSGWLPSVTVRSAMERPEPLVLSFAYERRRPIGRPRAGHGLVTVYELTSEDLLEPGNEFAARLLGASEGILLAIDPYEFAAQRADVPPWLFQPMEGRGVLGILDAITTTLEGARPSARRAAKPRVAAVVTKCDSVDAPAASAGGTVAEMLERWGAGAVVAELARNFDARYFAASALGVTPDYEEDRVPVGGPNPQGVLAPLEWLIPNSWKLPPIGDK